MEPGTMWHADYSSFPGLRSGAIHKNAANPTITIPMKIKFSNISTFL